MSLLSTVMCRRWRMRWWQFQRTSMTLSVRLQRTLEQSPVSMFYVSSTSRQPLPSRTVWTRRSARSETCSSLTSAAALSTCRSWRLRTESLRWSRRLVTRILVVRTLIVAWWTTLCRSSNVNTRRTSPTASVHCDGFARPVSEQKERFLAALRLVIQSIFSEINYVSCFFFGNSVTVFSCLIFCLHFSFFFMSKYLNNSYFFVFTYLFSQHACNDLWCESKLVRIVLSFVALYLLSLGSCKSSYVLKFIFRSNWSV